MNAPADRTVRLALDLTPDEVSDLVSAVVTQRERRDVRAADIELDPSSSLDDEQKARRLAERARTLAAKLAVVVNAARDEGEL
jgi:hypothetical protein